MLRRRNEQPLLAGREREPDDTAAIGDAAARETYRDDGGSRDRNASPRLADLHFDATVHGQEARDDDEFRLEGKSEDERHHRSRPWREPQLADCPGYRGRQLRIGALRDVEGG